MPECKMHARHCVLELYSHCDLLMAELNAAGIRLGPEHHGTIDWLECRLRRLNDGQGIGFRLGHTVVNRKFLTVLGFKLLGSFTTLYAIIISLGDMVRGTLYLVRRHYHTVGGMHVYLAQLLRYNTRCNTGSCSPLLHTVGADADVESTSRIESLCHCLERRDLEFIQRAWASNFDRWA